MRRAAAFFALFAPACSLIWGIHDNQAPSDAGAADVAEDVAAESAPDAAPWNGCPADAGAHTFCELFDESPPWPDDAAMPTIEGAPALSFDAGCASPPGCLVSDGANGSAARNVATPSGVSLVRMELAVRHDRVASGTSPVPRAFWIDFHTGGSTTTFGMTFLDSAGSAGDYLFWAQGANVASAAWTPPSTLGKWYDVRLTVDVANGVLSLAFPPAQALSDPFATINVSLKPSEVTSLTFHAGMGTGGAQFGVSVDDVVVDVQ